MVFSLARSNRKEAPASSRYSDKDSRMGGMYRFRYFKDATFDALALIQPIVKKHSLSMLEVAFRRLVHHSALKMQKKGGNDGIIMGVSRFGQLEMNLEFCGRGHYHRMLWTFGAGVVANKGDGAESLALDLSYAYDTQMELLGQIEE